jgi:hypothetical protein
VSRPALGPTQTHLQWVPGVLSPGLKRGGGVTLTIHPHLVPRSRLFSDGYERTPRMCCWRSSLFKRHLVHLKCGMQFSPLHDTTYSALHFSETSVCTFDSIWRHNPQHCHPRLRENLKHHTDIYCYKDRERGTVTVYLGRGGYHLAALCDEHWWSM